GRATGRLSFVRRELDGIRQRSSHAPFPARARLHIDELLSSGLLSPCRADRRGVRQRIDTPPQRERGEVPMEAPQSGKVWRIGFMTNGVGGPDSDGLQNGFARLGYAESQNIVFEPRFAEHQLDRHASFAADLVRFDVDLILTFGGPA